MEKTNKTVKTVKTAPANVTAPKAKKLATAEAATLAPLALKRFSEGVSVAALLKAGGRKITLAAWHTDSPGFVPTRATDGPFAGKRFPCVAVPAAVVASIGTARERAMAIQAHMSGHSAVFYASLDDGATFVGAPGFMSDSELEALSAKAPAKAPKAEKEAAPAKAPKKATKEAAPAKAPKKATKEAEPLAVKAGKLAGKLVKSVSAR